MSEVYRKLRQRLEEFAIPAVPGEGILEFLRVVFTEKEAEMLSKFKSFNRLLTIEEFARENEYSYKVVREVFLNLARRNLIRYEKIDRKEYFRLQPLVVGIHEAFFSTWREQNPETLLPAAKAIEKYLKATFHKAASNSKSPWARVIPSMGAVEAIIKENPHYYPTNQIKITTLDKIRRLGAILKYGGRTLIKMIFQGKINDLLNLLKTELFTLFDKRKVSLVSFRESTDLQKATKESKVINIDKKVPAEMQIYPYEVVRYYIDKAVTISVAPCPCRKANELLSTDSNEKKEKSCKFPVEETCIHLRYDNREANKYNLRGGRIISKDEALEILDKCEAAGLVHTSFNSRKNIEFICNCCPCCCDIIGTMTKYHQKLRAFIESNFQPKHQRSECIKCGICIKKCPTRAILQDEEGYPKIDFEACIGCGVCVSNCKKDALKLVKYTNQRPAIDTVESYAKFANEKVN